MTPWEEYVTAAQRLDTVRREANAVVAEQTAAQKAARDELAVVRSRLALQQARLVDAARQAGTTVVLAAPPEELEAARVTLGDPPAPSTVRTAVRSALGAVDAGDAILSGTAPGGGAPSGGARGAVTPGGSTVLRDAGIYAGYAVVAAVLWTFGFLIVQGALALLLLICSPVLPAAVFALGWLTIGALASPSTAAGGEKVNRHPALGGALSLLSLLPLLGLLILTVAHAASG